MKITQEQMKQSCRWMDEVGLEVALKEVGVEFSEALHVMHQRALRIVALRRGKRYWAKWMAGGLQLSPTPEEINLLPVMESMWLDGFVNGLKSPEFDV